MKTKNLFKLALIMLLICAFAFGFNTTVKATTTLEDLTDDSGGITKIDNGNSSYTLKVNKLTNINLQIKSGEKVTLDLNGNDLDNTSTEGMPTILVDQGAELTIINNGGSAYVRRDMVIPDFVGSQPVIRNYGTLTITGGTILTSEQSCYGIENSGKLTISGGGIVVSTEKTYGIFNLTNGEVNITDGRFQQGAIPNGHSADTPLVVNQGKLNITGGTFINNTGNKVPSIADVTGGTANVTGGQFIYQDPNNDYAQENQDMSTLIPDNYELDSNGNVVEKQEQADPTEPTEPTDPTEQPTEPTEPTEPTTPEESETTEIPEETKTPSESKEKDNTPKTGSANVALMATVVSAISLAGIVTVKKYTK